MGGPEDGAPQPRQSPGPLPQHVRAQPEGGPLGTRKQVSLDAESTCAWTLDSPAPRRVWLKPSSLRCLVIGAELINTGLLGERKLTKQSNITSLFLIGLRSHARRQDARERVLFAPTPL